jgi:hypothetical protein
MHVDVGRRNLNIPSCCHWTGIRTHLQLSWRSKLCGKVAESLVGFRRFYLYNQKISLNIPCADRPPIVALNSLNSVGFNIHDTCHTGKKADLLVQGRVAVGL